MSHFVKLNGSFQQGPGKGDKKAVFFGLESHTMAGIADFFPKNISALFAWKRPINGLQMKAIFYYTWQRLADWKIFSWNQVIFHEFNEQKGFIFFWQDHTRTANVSWSFEEEKVLESRRSWREKEAFQFVPCAWPLGKWGHFLSDLSQENGYEKGQFGPCEIMQELLSRK